MRTNEDGVEEPEEEVTLVGLYKRVEELRTRFLKQQGLNQQDTWNKVQ